MNIIKLKLLKIKNELLREILITSFLKIRTKINSLKILFNVFFRSNSKKSSEYYGAVNLLDELSKKYENISMGKEIEAPYFLQISFFNFVLQNYNYTKCLELGSYKGELLSVLANNNANIDFLGFDLNKHIIDINDYYTLNNLKFKYLENGAIDFKRYGGEGNVLLVTKAVLMYFTQVRIEEFFKESYLNNVDIVIAEPTRKRYNCKSVIMNVNVDHEFKSYSHPYALYLKRAGYNIVYDSNILNLGLLNFPQYSPYYLTMIYASKENVNCFNETYEKELGLLV